MNKSNDIRINRLNTYILFIIPSGSFEDCQAEQFSLFSDSFFEILRCRIFGIASFLFESALIRIVVVLFLFQDINQKQWRRYRAANIFDLSIVQMWYTNGNKFYVFVISMVYQSLNCYILAFWSAVSTFNQRNMNFSKTTWPRLIKGNVYSTTATYWYEMTSIHHIENSVCKIQAPT